MTKSDQLRALREARAKKPDPSDTRSDLQRWADIIEQQGKKSGGGEPIGAKRQPRPGTPGPSDTKSKARSSAVEQGILNAKVAGSDPAASATKRKPGRPKITGPRPWEVEGISRRTWHRRRNSQSGKAG